MSERAKQLQNQIERGRHVLERTEKLSRGECDGWISTAEGLVGRLFGAESVEVKGFKITGPSPTLRELADGDLERAYRGKLDDKIKFLESLIESLGEEGGEVSTSHTGLEEPNKLILSWSGRTSHKLATFLYEWCRKVIPGITPWISSEDISKGRRWFPELMTQLGKSTTCLICVTPENHRAPWVYYEAGVISAHQENGRICTVLFGVTTAAIDFTPLSQFQATVADKDDMWRLVRDLNRGLTEGMLEEPTLRIAYEAHWPDLKQCIDEALMHSEAPAASAETIDLLSQYQLSDEAKEMLREACKDKDGRILFMQHDGGLEFQINGRTFVNGGDGRVQAAWKSGFKQLGAAGLIENYGNSGEMLQVTNEGFKVGDSL